MRLCKLKQFRSMYYAMGSEPALSTLRARINAGTLPGGVIESGRYYVDLDEHERITKAGANLESLRRQLIELPELEGLI
jgi:hypothetical protein